MQALPESKLESTGVHAKAHVLAVQELFELLVFVYTQRFLLPPETRFRLDQRLLNGLELRLIECRMRVVVLHAVEELLAQFLNLTSTRLHHRTQKHNTMHGFFAAVFRST
jgi:hypothetical protein